MDDDAKWLSAVSGICFAVLLALIVVCVTIVKGCHECEETNRAYINAGMTQDAYGHWIKTGGK